MQNHSITPYRQKSLSAGNQYTFIALLFILGLMLSVPAFASETIGSVFKVTGDCTITRGEDTLVAAQDQPIMLKDEISTSPGSQISILFVDETTLSLDESSHASIDSYVYNEKDSNLLFKFTEGTFRAVTGGIVKANPEGFNMETPLATLGIRGSDIYTIVQPDGEEAGALHLGENHALEVKTSTQTVRITESGMRVRISPIGVIFTPTRIPASMFNNMINLGAVPQGTSPSAPAAAPTTRSGSTAPKSLKTPTSKTSPSGMKRTPSLKAPVTRTAPTLKAPVTRTTPILTTPVTPQTPIRTPVLTPTAPVQPEVKPQPVRPRIY